MKHDKVLPAVLSLLLLWSCFSPIPEEEGTQFISPHSTSLYGRKVSGIKGGLELVRGDFIPWVGNASLIWEVDIPEKGTYEFYLIANVGTQGNGTKITLKTAEMDYDFLLEPTSGPFQGGENFQVEEAKNFQRLKLPGLIILEAGTQEISISTSGIKKEGLLFDFRSAELLPLSKKEEIIGEEKRAKEARASFDWMNEAGYGLMFHWTSQSVQPDGTLKTYEDAVNAFDVQKFTELVEATGAAYVFLTIGHAESYCPAPIRSWERIHPGHTTRRDLINEIADALNAKNVKFLCYINGPLAFKFPREKQATDEENQAFVANFTNILTEMGKRYQDKIAGYWFDSWYRIFENYPEVPFETFFRVAKTGNKDRIICLNPWIYPDVTPWQDYWSGETQDPIEVPENGYMKNGSSPHLPYQVLLTMEKHLWVQKEAPIANPKFTSEELSSYIRDCMDNGGAVTVNLAIYQDGTVGEKALEVMKGVKDKIR